MAGFTLYSGLCMLNKILNCGVKFAQLNFVFGKCQFKINVFNSTVFFFNQSFSQYNHRDNHLLDVGKKETLACKELLESGFTSFPY